MNYVRAEQLKGLNTKPGVVNSGRNGGYQVINLAFHFGASRIALVAYDMQHTRGKSHHHGDHPQQLSNAVGIHNWVADFGDLANDLKRMGVEVVNCSIHTAIKCWPRVSLEQLP